LFSHHTDTPKGLDQSQAFFFIYFVLKEVELFNPTMLKKPLVLAINKIDLPNSTDLIEETIEKLQNYEGNYLTKFFSILKTNL